MQRQGKPKWSLQTTITFLVCLVVLMALLVTDLLITWRVTQGAQQAQAEKATDIARMTAQNPIVIAGLSSPEDGGAIQQTAEKIRRATHVEFVVVMDMKGIRKSHPNKDRIGQHFVGGDEGAVLKGKETTSIAKGTLGPSLRAFTPVYNQQKEQIGAVAVGISLEKVNNAVSHSRHIIYIALCFGLMVGVIGAVFLAKKIKNILFGLEPGEIAKILEERSAMIQSAKEGIIAVNQKGMVTLINHEGKRLLQKAGMAAKEYGQLEDYLSSAKFKQALLAGESLTDFEQELNGITILINQSPVIVKENIVGAILTFRDKTEIKQLAEQLTGARVYAEALRARSHEFMNKLHVILGLIHMENYQALSSYITDIVDHQQSEVTFVVERFRDPVLAGFILGKLSYAREAGADFIISGEGILPKAENPDTIHNVITILGNLIDNALDAVKDSPQKRLTLRFDYFEDTLVVELHDTGKGIADPLKDQIFSKGFSTKGENRGFGLFLAWQSVERLNGEIELESRAGEGTTFIVSIPYKSKKI